VKRSIRFSCAGLLAILMILAAPLRENHAQQPSQYSLSASDELMHRAALLIRDLHRRDAASREESEYLNLVGVYERAVRLDETRMTGDAALAAAAETYREMALQFKKQRYFYSAIECYGAILKQYPNGPFLTRALTGMAHIHEHDLQEPEAAARAYSDIIRRFPQSVTAREAEACLVRLQKGSGGINGNDVIEVHSDEDAAGIATVSQVRHFSGPDYARVILDLSVTTQYERKMEGSSLVIKLPTAKVSPLISQLQNVSAPGGMLKQIRLSAKDSAVEIRIDCSRLRDFAIFSLDNPARLVADLRGSRPIGDEAEIAETQPALPAVKPGTPGSMTLMRALGLKVRRIVIDPGHGGSDTGAIGRDGSFEKDIVLDIGLRLRAVIQRELKDVEVIMTRETDKFVPLDERTAIANARQADLFISIHLNSSPAPQASGIETYFLSLDANKDELDVATRENALTTRNAGELQSLLQKIVTDTRINESREFAQHVQTSLVSGIGRVSPSASFNRGVKKAPFVVLLGANMPSVLAEVSFLSHPKDGEALRTSEFRQQIAESLFGGIKTYVDSLTRTAGN
jgi:N-acetylmuramoyl-L-alanine amidase